MCNLWDLPHFLRFQVTLQAIRKRQNISINDPDVFSISSPRADGRRHHCPLKETWQTAGWLSLLQDRTCHRFTILLVEVTLNVTWGTWEKALADLRHGQRCHWRPGLTLRSDSETSELETHESRVKVAATMTRSSWQWGPELTRTRAIRDRDKAWAAAAWGWLTLPTRDKARARAVELAGGPGRPRQGPRWLGRPARGGPNRATRTRDKARADSSGPKQGPGRRRPETEPAA